MSGARLAGADKRNAETNVARVAEALGLGHWTIEIASDYLEPDEDGTLATVECFEDRNRAVIRFAAAAFDAPPAERIATIAHELLHVHDARLEEHVRDLRTIVPAKAWRYFERVFERAVELRVESLAQALAPVLPDWEDA